MRKALILLIASITLSGCAATTCTKTVSVTKDKDGNIISTTETESVSQPGEGWPIKLNMLKGVQP